MAFDLNSLFSKKGKSSSVAKDRLQLVLVHDRLKCDNDIIEKIRKDVIEVISKYVDIDMEEFDIQVCNVGEENTSVLSANIPIKNIKK